LSVLIVMNLAQNGADEGVMPENLLVSKVQKGIKSAYWRHLMWAFRG